MEGGGGGEVALSKTGFEVIRRAYKSNTCAFARQQLKQIGEGLSLQLICGRIPLHGKYVHIIRSLKRDWNNA